MNFRIMEDALRCGLPTWTVIQNWILRYGLFKLKQPLQKRDDWIYIMDHTIEFGIKKCFVVLAVSIETLRNKNFRLTHQDMEVAAISIDEKATGERVYEVLAEAAKQTGVPVQTVEDAGSNIKKGVALFKEDYPAVIPTYDITHKTAIMLKHYLGDCAIFKSFSNKVSETKRKTVHTEFSHLGPKKPRDKSRWLNIKEHLKWAEDIKIYRKQLNHKKGRPSRERRELLKKFDSLFGWINEYDKHISKWKQVVDVLKAAEHELKTKGISKKSVSNLKQTYRSMDIVHKDAIEMKNKMIAFIKKETESFDDFFTGLGTSDIIESIFGKYKLFSARTPMKEVGKALLTIPVMISKVTLKEVKEAMETVSTKELDCWLKKNLGESLFVKRKKAFQAGKAKNEVKKFPQNQLKAVGF